MTSDTMFGNFIYFILVLLIYSTYQPSEETNFDGPETALLLVSTAILFAVFARLRSAQVVHQEVHDPHGLPHLVIGPGAVVSGQ